MAKNKRAMRILWTYMWGSYNLFGYHCTKLIPIYTSNSNCMQISCNEFLCALIKSTVQPTAGYIDANEATTITHCSMCGESERDFCQTRTTRILCVCMSFIQTAQLHSLTPPVTRVFVFVIKTNSSPPNQHCTLISSKIYWRILLHLLFDKKMHHFQDTKRK